MPFHTKILWVQKPLLIKNNKIEECIKIYGRIRYLVLLWVQKPLLIKFDKIEGFIKIYDSIRYLVLFSYWWYDEIFDNIKYLTSKKSGITGSINHSFARIRTDSYNFFI